MMWLSRFLIFVVAIFFCLGAGWQVEEDKDAMTDEPRAYFVRQAEESSQIAIVGLCEGGRLVGLGLHIPGMDGTPDSSLDSVMLRFDSGEPITDRSVSSTPSTLRIPNAHRYLSQLLGSERLIIRYSGTSRMWTWSFKLEGLKEVFQAHAAVCGPIPEPKPEPEASETEPKSE